MQDSERALYEVGVYENRIDLLLSVHKECGKEWDWKRIKNIGSPLEPVKNNAREKWAQAQLKQYQPSTLEKLTGRGEKKRQELIQLLEHARKLDESDYQKALPVYKREYAEWEERRELAERVLEGNLEAYVEVLKEVRPLSDVSQLGSSIQFGFKNALLAEIDFYVNDEQVIPKEVKSLLKSGKVSTKEMPKGKFFELYQDYVCGCALRVARETFALLPVKLAVVNAIGKVLNTQTGNLENKPILSVAIPRKTLSTLSFETLDPSDSMQNFVQRMNFKRGQSFGVIDPIKLDELKLEEYQA